MTIAARPHPQLRYAAQMRLATPLRQLSLWLSIGLLIASCWLWWTARHNNLGTPTPALVSTGMPYSYADAVDRIAPAVVSLDIVRQQMPKPRSIFDNERLRNQLPKDDRSNGLNGGLPPDVQTSVGSGVVVSREGHILTNHHVIADAKAIRVRFTDGQQGLAKLIGTDPETDLALLKTSVDEPPFARFAPPGLVRVGDVVLAIGNPFGVGQTVTQGIISATGRSGLELSVFESFLQTDAAINPGNSGGALVNVYGELIGINTALFSHTGGSQGIGFAIPAPLAEAVMQQLLESGSVTRGWLGVVPQPLTPELSASIKLPPNRGLLVADVVPGSPAEAAGLQRGDILVSIDEKPIYSPRDALEYVASQQPGDRITVDVVRRRERSSIEVQITRRTVNRVGG